MTVRIGLTGPIGCGKSTVAGWLAALGATVVDADKLVREVSAPGGPVAAAIIDRFGDAVRADDGDVDRAKLGRLVFADPVGLADLEAIVHPAVRPLIRAAIEDATAAGVPAVVIEAIKLVEAGYAAECDEVWIVTCDPAEQRGRLRGRGLEPADVDQRIAAQAGLVERLRPAATRLVDTSGDRAGAQAVVAGLWREVLGG